MNKKEINPLLASSGNPAELSTTIQGGLIALAPIVIALMQARGVQVTETQIVDIVQQFLAILSVATLAYGSVRKFATVIKKTFGIK